MPLSSRPGFGGQYPLYQPSSPPLLLGKAILGGIPGSLLLGSVCT